MTVEGSFDWPRLLHPFYITPLSEWSCSPYTADRDGCLQWKSWNNNPSSFHHQTHPLILNSGQDLVNLRLSVIPQRSRHLWPSLQSVDCFSALDHKGGLVLILHVILFWLIFIFLRFFLDIYFPASNPLNEAIIDNLSIYFFFGLCKNGCSSFVKTKFLVTFKNRKENFECNLHFVNYINNEELNSA